MSSFLSSALFQLQTLKNALSENLALSKFSSRACKEIKIEKSKTDICFS